ncbi:hypothetical protein BGZ83_010672 [Gryganskiella cystojenkinii]|nr:hypothetical protein BGZ83_010672 [Gryganskiella cystojenkinii]
MLLNEQAVTFKVYYATLMLLYCLHRSYTLRPLDELGECSVRGIESHIVFPDVMRHIVLLLGVAVTCVRAAYYIVDVSYYPQEMVYSGVLRYPADSNFPLAYAECGSSSSMLVNQGDTFGAGIVCKGLKTTIGLNFPNGYNATTGVTDAYDFHREEYYPCQKINEDYHATTYACGGVHIDYAPDEPVTSMTTTTAATNAPATTAVPTSAVAVNTTTAVPSTTVVPITTVVPSTKVTMVVSTTTTVHSTVRTTVATPSPTSSCAAGVYGKKRGQGKAGQCCKTDADCKQSCMKGVCGTCGVNFKC